MRVHRNQIGATYELEELRRTDLLEALDRLVTYERYYHSIYGHYTQLVSRLGFSLPASLNGLYGIRVTAASREHLMVMAFSEVGGRLQDTAWIDQDFRIQANFPLPSPRVEYLRKMALKQLRRIREQVGEAGEVEEGVFRGYFRYETRPDLHGNRMAVATGTRWPVEGMEIWAEKPGQDRPEGSLVELADALVAPGTSNAAQPGMSTMEEAYLAQRIFRGEIGRDAHTWSELSSISSFRFDERERYGSRDRVPFGVAPAELGARQPDRAPAEAAQPLEIEPLFPVFKKN